MMYGMSKENEINTEHGIDKLRDIFESIYASFQEALNYILFKISDFVIPV